MVDFISFEYWSLDEMALKLTRKQWKTKVKDGYGIKAIILSDRDFFNRL